jgi:hypothetical protein
MIQFYKNQFQWTSGVENVERVRLRDDSNIERFCSTCCHTPLGFSGASFDAFPFMVIHSPLLTITSTGAASGFAPIGFRLNVSKVPKDKRNFKDNLSWTQVAEGVPFAFLMKLMSRFMYGMMVGNNKPDPMTQVEKKARVLGINAPKK